MFYHDKVKMRKENVMDKQEILKEAMALQPELVSDRRQLHQHPEIAFDLTYTKEFVWNKLVSMGYEPKECGKSGIIVLAGGKKQGKCILLRADMDALMMEEEADVEYKSLDTGKMHGCGHDMHTAMLLGVAKILKNHEDEIEGTIKLEFQPAEENFQGSVDMIRNGLLENPHVDAAFMIHVIVGQPMPSGLVLVPGGGISMASCEQYHITVKGKGGHGSTPHLAVDPITAAAQIHLALAEINSRELDANAYGVFTTCHFEAGQASNVIPESAQMWGTIRTTDDDNEDGKYIKSRMTEICQGVATAMRCEATIVFSDYCPCMKIDEQLAKDGFKYVSDLIGQGAVDMSKVTGGKAGGGSEDFAFVSHEVPTLSMFLVAGSTNDGYMYGQHNPKVKFDDSVLYLGTAVHVQMALNWLAEHKDK